MRTGKQLLIFLFLLKATELFAQPASGPMFTAAQARNVAELMCRQLPNVGTILENRVEVSKSVSAPPPQEPMVIDDVGDALLRLGPYSLDCLSKKMLDAGWMPDPRSEPLLGTPMIGDIAYMILSDKGTPDLLPQLAHKEPNELRMDDYFIWPSVGNHRQRLGNAVRDWLTKHPDCCGTPPMVRPSSPRTLKFRMPKSDLERAQSKFLRVRLGMKPEQVLKIMGKPDATDSGDNSPDHSNTALLGLCANDHNEKLAYIYFIERWADEIARRDPLRDRYVIVFFSGEGKLTRMFSNVASIAPILPPRSNRAWLRLICSSCPKP